MTTVFPAWDVVITQNTLGHAAFVENKYKRRDSEKGPYGPNDTNRKLITH
jgi:hypothetical protein